MYAKNAQRYLYVIIPLKVVPRCKRAEFRRATDREVIDYIGSIFLAPLDNGKEMGGKITE